MKITRKVISVLLSAIFLFSAVSVGLVASADDTLDEYYELLAFSFFDYTFDSSNNLYLTYDENGIVQTSILGLLEQYTVSNTEDGYIYADSNGEAVRAIKYTHTVTAADDANSTIGLAAIYFAAIANSIMSYTYGSGYYTPDLVIDEVVETLKYWTYTDSNGDEQYLFLDGYIYTVDSYGDLTDVSTEVAYYVDEDGTYAYVDGEKTYFDDYSEIQEDTTIELSSGMSLSDIADLIDDGTAEYCTLWEYLNVETIITYFMGNGTSINSGNWFHDYEFYAITDPETCYVYNYNYDNGNFSTLTATGSTSLSINEYYITYSIARTWDDAGTTPQYAFDSLETGSNIKSSTVDISYLNTLALNIKNFCGTYTDSVLVEYTNSDLINLVGSSYFYGSSYYEAFMDLSTASKIALFDDYAYQYIHIIEQTIPYSTDTSSSAYLPYHEYENYIDYYDVDGDGSVIDSTTAEETDNVTYYITAEDLSTIVANVDALMLSEKLYNALSSFIDLSSLYSGRFSDLGSSAVTNINELLEKVIIPGFLYTDDIINTLFLLIYPMITDLLDEYITDEFMDDALGSFYSIVNWMLGIDDYAVGSSDGWQGLIYYILMRFEDSKLDDDGEGVAVGLNPSCVVAMWYEYGYITVSGTTISTTTQLQYLDSEKVVSIANYLLSCTTSGYKYAKIGSIQIYTGTEDDGYSGARWDGVNENYLNWGIDDFDDADEAQAAFIEALQLILTPLLFLLSAVLGGQKIEIEAISILDIEIECDDLGLNDSIYGAVIIPLFEALGITSYDGLVTSSVFESACKSLMNSVNYSNALTVLNYILDPIFNWLSNQLLVYPVETICELLPNVSLFLTSGVLLEAIYDIEIGIDLEVINIITVNNIYVLSIEDLLGDTDLSMLSSLDNILSLISFSGQTTVGVGYGYYLYKEGDTTSRLYGSYIYATEEEAEAAAETALSSNSSYSYSNTYVASEALLSDSGDGVMLSTTYYGTSYDGYTYITAYDAYGEVDDTYALKELVAYGLSSNGTITDLVTLDDYDYSKHSSYTTELYYYYYYYYYYDYNPNSDTYGTWVYSATDPGDDYAYNATVYYTYYEPTDLGTLGENYAKYVSYIYANVDIELPALMDYKLQEAAGSIVYTSSIRTCSIPTTSSSTVSATSWASGYKYYVQVVDWSISSDGTRTINDASECGYILIYLLRYAFGALKYEVLDSDYNFSEDSSNLLVAFGLGDTLDEDLFYGLSLGDIIDNLTLDPEAAIASLVELFIPQESDEDPFDYLTDVYYMDYVDYNYDTIYDAVQEYDDASFGSNVLYSEYWTEEDAEYVAENLTEVVDDILTIFGVSLGSLLGLEDDADSEDIENTLNSLVSGLLEEYLYTNDMISLLASALYQAIDSLGISDILKYGLDVDYSKQYLLDTLNYAFYDVSGYTSTSGYNTTAYAWILYDYNSVSGDEYTDDTFYTLQYDGIDDEGNDVYSEEAIEWGFGYYYYIDSDGNTVTDGTKLYEYWGISAAECFLRNISAVLSPFSILIEWFVLGEDLTILDLVTLPGYATYYYAIIPLFEALGATSDYGLGVSSLLSYQSYYDKVFNYTVSNGYTTYFTASEFSATDIAGAYNGFYYLLDPILDWVDALSSDLLTNVLTILPNIIFFLLDGCVNDVINNLVHVAYVLLDLIQPIYDAYPLINSLLANLDIGGMNLGLSLPLDVDWNTFINSLIESLVGSALSFDIENTNLVTGTTIEEQTVISGYDDDGEPIYETVEVEVDTYVTANLTIVLPYIDLTTFAVGEFIFDPSTVSNEVSGVIVAISGTGGMTDLLTTLLRLVMDVLFDEDNWYNIYTFLTEYCALDDEDCETLYTIMFYLYELLMEWDAPDRLLGVIYTIFVYLVPIADTLAERLSYIGMSLLDLIDLISTDFSTFVSKITSMLTYGQSSTVSTTMSWFERLINMIIAFFQSIGAWFQSIFS